MLKRNISYEDFDGNIVTEEFYFNLTRTEIIKMEAGGMEAMLKKIVADKDGTAIMAEFEKIILNSYGVKSDDGKRFVKNDQLREDFRNSAAYDSLFVELCTNEDAAALFVKGVIPREALEALMTQDKPSGPPLPPAS